MTDSHPTTRPYDSTEQSIPTPRRETLGLCRVTFSQGGIQDSVRGFARCPHGTVAISGSPPLTRPNLPPDGTADKVDPDCLAPITGNSSAALGHAEDGQPKWRLEPPSQVPGRLDTAAPEAFRDGKDARLIRDAGGVSRPQLALKWLTTRRLAQELFSRPPWTKAEDQSWQSRARANHRRRCPVWSCRE